MIRPVTGFSLVLLTASLTATAQMDVGNGDIPLKNGLPQSLAATQIFLSGKVVLDDGSPLPDRAEVETICNGQKRTRARTDSQGGFTFSLSTDGGSNSVGAQSAATGADNSWGGPMAPRRDEPDTQGCEVEAVLSGFTSEKISLGRGVSNLGQNNLGQIMLRRREQVEGLTISVISALAPEDARKDFKKALELEKKNQWDQAQEMLQKAVAIYPKYAIAWFELGRVAAQNSDRVEAERCWQQAIDADPRYVPSYPLLALAEAGQARWPRLVEVTEAWLALDPADYAEAWYLNSVGNYFVGNLASAEQSARQGIKLDSGHRVPKLQYVLGMILIQKRAYLEAAEHLQIYLQMVSKPADVNEAQKQLAEIERLSSGVKVAGVPNRP